MQDTRITAGMVAAELRKLADALDKNPEAEIQRAFVSFHHHFANEKTKFLALADLLPRPLKKEVTAGSYPSLKLNFASANGAMWGYSEIPQSLTCALVEPAKPAVYKCDPILSAIEEAALEGAA